MEKKPDDIQMVSFSMQDHADGVVILADKPPLEVKELLSNIMSKLNDPSSLSKRFAKGVKGRLLSSKTRDYRDRN